MNKDHTRPDVFDKGLMLITVCPWYRYHPGVVATGSTSYTLDQQVTVTLSSPQALRMRYFAVLREISHKASV